jgi:hypothetical protein
MPSPLKAAARVVLEGLNSFHPAHLGALRISRLERQVPPRSVEPSPQHLSEAIGWTKRAQDSHTSGGVAWGYRARSPVRSGLERGWVNPYPETTGYTIPTMLRYAEMFGDEDSAVRARRMLDWELSIQMPDGGTQGGTLGATPVASSTFVTGQVLFGYLAAHRKFQDERILEAARRAGDWLLGCLDETGRFVRGYSHFCAPGAKAYEARTGAAVAGLGLVTGDQRYVNAASSMADFAMSLQQSNGWFAENDLNHHDQPLTHTIGYVLEGLHEIGTHTGRSDCIAAVRRALDAIEPVVRSDGYLAGRLRSDWTPAVDWVCLTGTSQIAGVFLRMYRETGEPRYLRAGRTLLGFVCFTQELRSGDPRIDGGIRGSYPFSGAYLQWSVCNWPTKFFADSMMDFLDVQKAAKNLNPAVYA